MYDFIKNNEEHEEARKIEMSKLVEFLEKKGIKVLNKGFGRGDKEYTAGGKLEVPYDLSNWKWVNIVKGEYKYTISLQAYAKHVETGRVVVLMDRIGIYKYKEYSASEVIEKMVVTDIVLPFTEDKLNSILTYL